MRTSARLVDGGRWGRSVTAGSLMEPLVADRVAVLVCCTASGLPLGGELCGSKPRIKSFSGASSAGFTSVRAAGPTARAYSGELGRTAVNCNPNCNPEAGDPPDLCRAQQYPGYG
jgi:hypothetical protein